MTATPLARALATGGTEETRARKADGNFFPTPLDVTEALLRVEPLIRDRSRLIWEPHCGEGYLAERLKQSGHQVYASDLIDRGYRGAATGLDFLQEGLPAEIDGIVMNPPFDDIEAHIRHALSFGLRFVISLVQAEFWARKKHLALFRDHPPSRIYACAWKPDFTGEGSGIFCVQWCVWERGHEGPTEFRPVERPNMGAASDLFSGVCK